MMSRGAATATSRGAATESSPRREPWERVRQQPEPRQGRQKIVSRSRLHSQEIGEAVAHSSIAPPGLIVFGPLDPRLTPWATFWRHSVPAEPRQQEAAERRQKVAHGAIRGNACVNDPSPGRGDRKSLADRVFIPRRLVKLSLIALSPLRGSSCLDHWTHGASRGNACVNDPSPGRGDRKSLADRVFIPRRLVKLSLIALSPLRGSSCLDHWTHGSRRGLLSGGAPCLRSAGSKKPRSGDRK